MQWCSWSMLSPCPFFLFLHLITKQDHLIYSGSEDSEVWVCSWAEIKLLLEHCFESGSWWENLLSHSPSANQTSFTVPYTIFNTPEDSDTPLSPLFLAVIICVCLGLCAWALDWQASLCVSALCTFTSLYLVRGIFSSFIWRQKKKRDLSNSTLYIW